MEYMLLLYAFVSGVIYASYLNEEADCWWLNVLGWIVGLFNGWIATPILIGQLLNKLSKD